MSGLLFSLALLTALSAVGYKALARRSAGRARAAKIAAMPGTDPSKPLAIARFDEIDDLVHTVRCPCGGLLDRIGEGSRSTAAGSVRVLRTACLTCEEELDFFFDLTTLRH